MMFSPITVDGASIAPLAVLIIADSNAPKNSTCMTKGMWVSTKADNIAALATYRSAGASDPDPGVVLTWTFD